MLVVLRRSFSLVLTMVLITGVIYPLIVTGLAQLAFARAANGSVIERNGKVVGSELIGQAFSDPKYFWSRPSATSPYADNPSASGPSNLGPTNPALAAAVADRIKALREADPSNTAPVPVDLVTASASGVDPDISVAAAHYQVARVARVRNVSADQVTALVDRATQGRQLGVLGEPRVNVLALNLSLDEH